VIDAGNGRLPITLRREHSEFKRFFSVGIIRPFNFLCGLTGGEHKFALKAMNIRRLSQNRQVNRPFRRKITCFGTMSCKNVEEMQPFHYRDYQWNFYVW
jgi:hypothetical protein